MQIKNIKSVHIKILFVIAIGFIFYFFLIQPQKNYYDAHHVKINGIYLIKPIEIKKFELIDNHGKSFTRDNLKNHWTFLFFGFTHCGMVCPFTMNALNKMYQSLQYTIPMRDLPQVVFISVDPEHDTIEKLNKYVTSFNYHFIGGKTTIEKTSEIEKQFHISATQVQVNDSEPSQYTINHSSEIVLINPEAKIQAYFSYPPQADQMAKDYNLIINKKK